MLKNTEGANLFTVEELEELFNDDGESKSPATDTQTETDVQGGTDNAADDKSNNVEHTRAFAARLKESTEKARKEEREAVAKELGYDSYEAMQQERANKIVRDRGLDPEEVTPIVEELLKHRLDNDPRMQELESFRKKELAKFARSELSEITKLTGGEITSITQIPKNVIDRWQQTGSLKSAFLELEGEKLINKVRSEQTRGTTSHMQSLGGSTPANTNQRHLNEQEKQMWRYFNPGISEEELNKKLVEK